MQPLPSEWNLNELALFAGAGGGILGGKLLGWTTVCAVEYNAYARSVLLARQNDGTLAPFPIWDDVRTFDGKPWRGLVDVVSGGFPCQDISAAGKGAGIDGERSGLWGEMARIIREVQPRFVFVENSPMLTSRGLGRVLGDLAEMGFDAEWGVVSAADTGAPHIRERIWIVAYPMRDGQLGQATTGVHPHNSQWSAEACGTEWRDVTDALEPSCEDVADADSLWELQPQGSEQNFRRWAGNGRALVANAERFGRQQVEQAEHRGAPSQRPADTTQYASVAGRLPGWPAEPGLGRVADGVAHRVDRIKSLGNGQVSRVAATAWSLLKC